MSFTMPLHEMTCLQLPWNADVFSITRQSVDDWSATRGCVRMSYVHFHCLRAQPLKVECNQSIIFPKWWTSCIVIIVYRYGYSISTLFAGKQTRFLFFIISFWPIFGYHYIWKERNATFFMAQQILLVHTNTQCMTKELGIWNDLTSLHTAEIYAGEKTRFAFCTQNKGIRLQWCLVCWAKTGYKNEMIYLGRQA